MALNELHRARTLIFSCKYHVVFCPKYRRKLLVPPIDRRIKEMILEKQDQYSYTVVEMEVMPDHVHLLLDVDPRIGIDRVVRKIKGVYGVYAFVRNIPGSEPGCRRCGRARVSSRQLVPYLSKPSNNTLRSKRGHDRPQRLQVPPVSQPGAGSAARRAVRPQTLHLQLGDRPEPGTLPGIQNPGRPAARS